MSRSSATGVTAICLPASFQPDSASAGTEPYDSTHGSAPERPQPATRVRATGLGLVLATGLLTASAQPGTPAGSVGITVDRAQLAISPAQLSITLQALRAGPLVIPGISLVCPHGTLGRQGIDCHDGELRVIDGSTPPMQVRARIAGQGNTIELNLSDTDGGQLTLTRHEDGNVDLVLQRLRLGPLLAWLPTLTPWSPDGRLSGSVAYRAGQDLIASLRLDEGSMASADGLQAAEALEVMLTLSAHHEADGWHWQLRTDWRSGAAFIDPWYIEADGQNLVAEGMLNDHRLALTQAQVALPGGTTLTLTGDYDRVSGRLTHAAAALAQADVSTLMSRYVLPAVAPAINERLACDGLLSASLAWSDDRLTQLGLRLDQASCAFNDRDIGAGPLNGHAYWTHPEGGSIGVSVEGGRWEQIPLGAFHLTAQLGAKDLRLPATRIPVLDSALVIESMALAWPEDAPWSGSARAHIEPLSMPRLSEALGLPTMKGTLSASMPGIAISPTEIRMEGAMVIALFDGFLQFDQLVLREPFGRSARLDGQLIGRQIDLFQLTEALSFGSITGRIDADITDLSLVDWQPVRMNAHLYSSPGDYPRRISQRAVENLSALGGGGAMAALQRSALSVFDSFGYRQIALRCQLHAELCEMGGIEPLGTPRYTLVQGGGIPSLTVVGYNPRVAWRELIERLKAVAESNASPVIR